MVAGGQFVAQGCFVAGVFWHPELRTLHPSTDVSSLSTTPTPTHTIRVEITHLTLGVFENWRMYHGGYGEGISLVVALEGGPPPLQFNK